MTIISLWVKNEAKKLISGWANRKTIRFISKARLCPVESRKGKIPSVSRCHDDKSETFEWKEIGWWAVWKAYHIRKVSWHLVFKYFMGNHVKKRGVGDVLSQGGRTEQRTPSGIVWINMSKNLFGYEREQKWSDLHWKVKDSPLQETIWRWPPIRMLT